jgi:hypothetical protein
MVSAGLKLPDSLIRIVKGIEKDLLMNCHKLVDLIKQEELKEEDFLPLSYFGHPSDESYGRTIAYEGTNFSIYLMSWGQGDFTAIHSHGLCDWGAVYFLGDVDHRLYNASGKSIELVQKAIVAKGITVPVKGNLVHAMGNLHENPVMSLHIYGWDQAKSNANDNALVYELEKNQIRTTNGSAFLNIKEEFCRETETGIETNSDTITDYFEIILPFYKKNKISQMTDFIEEVLKKPELSRVENNQEK